MIENEVAINETTPVNTDDIQEAASHPPPFIGEGNNEIIHTEESQATTMRIIPKPVFMRLLMLFGGGAGCLLVGIIVSMVTGDTVLLAMSAILGISFAVKGFMLKRKINTGQIFSVAGVCVSMAPKMLGRYRRIELVDTDTGDDVSFILPKKVVFKVGHVYTCYFDSQVGNRPLNINHPKGGFFYADMDLPTNGFLGFEDFGVYQEKPVLAAASTDDKTKNDEEEKDHEASEHH